MLLTVCANTPMPRTPVPNSLRSSLPRRQCRHCMPLGAPVGATRSPVEISHQWAGEPCDALIALHARKSFAAIERYRRDHPDRPLIVALTGTDRYSDLPTSAEARKAPQLASRLIALQPLAADHVPAHLRSK